MTTGMALRCVLGAIALLTGATAPAGPADDIRSYRVRLPLHSGPGGGVQRLAIPAAVLAGSLTADLADVRVFDARGRAMPIARAPARAPHFRSAPLKPMPVLATADALQVRGVSLKIDPEGRARVTQVNGTVADSGTTVLLGALFDARGTRAEAGSLSLDAILPEGQPVTFTAEASRDLAAWRPLGERTSYRAPGTAATSRVTIPLGRAALRDDYLRVTWRTGSRPLSPVQVRTAVLTVRSSTSPLSQQVEATPPPLRDPHVIDVAVPFATPIDSLSVTPVGTDLIVPVRILGRDTAEQPWRVLGAGAAVRSVGATRPSAPIALDGGAVKWLRIEAARQGAGFSATPTLRIGFAPRDLLFLAAGTAPFTLAAGRTGTADAYLPADDLLRAAGGAETVATVANNSPVLQLAEPTDGSTRRRAALWAVLLAATGLLAGFAWLLWRREVQAD